MKYRFYTRDVFTNKPFSVTPLAVLPCAESLSSQEMLFAGGALGDTDGETEIVFEEKTVALAIKIRKSKENPRCELRAL